MKKLLFFLLLLPRLAVSQFDFLPSDRLQISVITCGPSQEQLYTAFGHSAIRVWDPVNGFDAAYNWGVFDFNQPNFYINFAKGFLYYRLGVYDYQNFQAHYIADNRYVHEQVLNLTHDQKLKLFDYLQVNALPENQSYRYDYFYNNCATKIRDVVEQALGKDVVRFDGSYIDTQYTIRDLTDVYLNEQPWGDLGIDIGLGLPIDKIATPYEYMFLPDYVESGFDHATITTNGVAEPIVSKKNIVYEVRPMEEEDGLPHPLYFTCALALVAALLTWWDLRRRNISAWFDAVLFGAAGLVGVLLFFLWFFTDHDASAGNLNVLWAFPLHLVAVVCFFKNPAWLRPYFLFALILCAATIILWGTLPQDLNETLLPVVMAMGMRSFAQYYVRAKTSNRIQHA